MVLTIDAYSQQIKEQPVPFYYFMTFLLVGIASILDARIFQTGSVLRTAVIFFYLSNEGGVSLLENAAHLGLPIPRVVKKALKQLHDKSEDDDKENKNEQ